MNKKFRDLSIAARLALLALLSILLVLGGLSAYVAKASKNALLAEEVEALKQKNRLVIDMIDTYDQSLRRPMFTLTKVFRGLFPSTFNYPSIRSRSVTKYCRSFWPIWMS